MELGTVEKLPGIEELVKFHLCMKSYHSMYGQDILCGISKVTFEISHKNILPAHSNMWILYMDEILRVLSFRLSLCMKHCPVDLWHKILDCLTQQHGLLHLQPYAHQHFDTNFLYLIKAYWYLFMLIVIHICLSGCPYIASQSLFMVRKFHSACYFFV